MAIQHESDSAFARAVRKAGSQVAFGRIIGKRQSVVNDWLREDKPLPAEFVLTVEAATGISRHDLRPDIYPIEIASPDGHRKGQSAGMAPPAPATPAAGSACPAAGAFCSSGEAA